LAQSLGSMEGSDDYSPAISVAHDVSERVKVLQGLPGAIDRARKVVAQGADFQTEPARNFLNGMGLDADAALETMKRMYGEAPRDAAALVKLGDDKTKPHPDVQARQLQEAWALVNAGRVQRAVFSGGDVGNPKAEAQGQGNLWVAKAASTRPASIVRKSRDSSPLAKAISRRRLAGLQYVPTKV